MGEQGPGVWQRWFGRKHVEVEAPAAAGPSQALATLGALLKDYLDIDLELEDPQARLRLGRLGAYLRELHRKDGGHAANDDDALPPLEPDWDGLRAVFAKQRRAERDFVQKTFRGLKQALVEVAQGFTRAIEGDREGDERVAGSLDGLRDLASAPGVDLARLKRSVLETVTVVEAAAVERTQRQQREIGRLKDVLRTMRVELKRAHAMAETDGLTGVANRATLDQHLLGTAALGTVHGQATTLLLLDLDHFKQVNDRHGHPAGDAVLRAVADTLRGTQAGGLKRRESDVVARYGGEEFAVVLHDCRQADAAPIAEKLRRAVEETQAVHEGKVLRVTVSIGVAERGLDECHESWLERTDRALYGAKHAGRNRVQCAPPLEAEAG